MSTSDYKILSDINTPYDVRKLNVSQLPELCAELRRYIIDVVSVHPGHFGSSLGAVELAVAIHYVFDTPYDNLVWDVGHQAYAHKIITGRKDVFHTIRQFGGISGFPKMSESEYDSFGTGHASTSVSAALGMAIAAEQQHEDNRNTIAVFGDGALTGGMIYEALNNAGFNKSNIILILNDNGIAIDKTTGYLKYNLLNLALSKRYNGFKDRLFNKLVGRKEKRAQDGETSHRDNFVLQQIKRGLKTSIFNNSNIFESLGVRYFGPTNGNDVIQLVEILKQLKDIQGPKLLHCITKKGNGFPAAEKDPVTYHAPGTFNAETGETKHSNAVCPPKYQDVFGETMVRLAKENDKIVTISPAMLSGSSLKLMEKTFPHRCYDVGIAEEHAVTFSAGLAASGMRPYLAIYSSFLQRGYDQVIHDVALQKLPVVFCIDRAGLVGEDGATHHGAFDMAYLRSIPNMIIAAPSNEFQLQDLLYTAQFTKLPFAIRYPRGNGMNIQWRKDKLEQINIGQGRQLVQGRDIAIVTTGKPTNFVEVAIKMAKETKPDINPSHYEMIFLKPIDVDLLHQICGNHKYIITVEDGTITGGLGSAVAEFVVENGYNCVVRRLGIPDGFIEHGTLEQLYRLCNFDAAGIASTLCGL